MSHSGVIRTGSGVARARALRDWQEDNWLDSLDQKRILEGPIDVGAVYCTACRQLTIPDPDGRCLWHEPPRPL